MPFTIGNSMRLTVEFFDFDGDPIDPTTTTIQVEKKTSATITSHVYGVDLNVIRDGVGIYHLDVVLDEVGDWVYVGIGAGNVTSNRGKGFHVEAGEIG